MEEQQIVECSAVQPRAPMVFQAVEKGTKILNEDNYFLCWLQWYTNKEFYE